MAAAVVDGRFVTPVTIGGLTIRPATVGAPSNPLGLDRSEADRYVGYTAGLVGTPVVGFGVVTVAGVRPPAGTRALVAVPAWIGVWFPDSVAVSCPAEAVAPAGASSSRSLPPEVDAVLFYGHDGLGADVYDSGGTGPCGSTVAPGLTTADAEVPVAWQQVGPAGLTTTVSYQAPSCATLAGVAAGGNVRTGIETVTVTVTVPFDRADCRADATFTTTVSVYPSSVAPGAPPPPAHVVLVPSTAPAAVPPALVDPLPAGPVATAGSA